MHALTRYDSILTVTGVGKATTILKKLKLFSDLLDVGNSNTSIDDVVDSASLFVTTLFCKHEDENWSTVQTSYSRITKMRPKVSARAQIQAAI